MNAEYIKCDLHIHSDASNLTKDNDYKGIFCLKNLTDKLTLNDVKLFSITDHNIINVDAYKEFFTEYTNKGIEILVGVELDIHKEEYLMESLNILTNAEEVKNEKYHSLLIFKSSDYVKLSRYLDNMYQEIQEEFNQYYNNIDLFGKNLKHRLTSLDRVIKHFLNEEYLIISHGAKSSNIIKSYKGDLSTAQAMIILGVINSVEVGPTKVEAIKHFNKGFDEILQDNFKNRDDVPYVVFSDNHELESYPDFDSTQIVSDRPFTWLRGIPCFETLRLSFVDPNSRIRISENIPSKPVKYLKKMKFDTISGDGHINQNNVIFNSGINTIIGGRSSGKSLLLNSILYNIINTRNISQMDKYTMDSNKVIDDSSIQGLFNNEVEFSSNNTCKTYAYTQDQIVSKFNKDGLALEQELPFQKFDEDDIRDKINKYFQLLDDLVQTYENAYNSRHHNLTKLSVTDLRLKTEKKGVHYNYEDTLKSIKESIVENPEDTKKSIVNLKNLIESLRISLSIKYNEELLFDETELTTITELLEIVESKKTLLEKFYMMSIFKVKYTKDLESELLKEILEISSESDSLITKANMRIKKEKEKATKFIKDKHLFRNVIASLENIEIKFERLDKNISDDYILRTEIPYILNKEEFIKLIAPSITQFDSYNLLQTLIDMIYSDKDIRVSRKTNSPSDFKNLIDKLKLEIQKRLKPKYSIIEKGVSRDLSSDHMSPGKKASVYLEIILMQLRDTVEPTILIIDQPEDNLDNMFITDKLVNYIRNIRGIVQVILVTHNASLAINTDSDNIVIATNDDSIISYTNGGIEDIEFRETVCDLLDGGHHTFDQRYHKYDIPQRKIYEPLRKETNNEI